MSTVSGVSSESASVAYATHLAQSSQLQRSLYNLGAAVKDGDLNSAGTLLTALMKEYPQYASSSSSSSSSSGSTDTSDPVNAGFESLSTAIDNNDPNAAKGAWQQLTTDLANEGVTVSDSSDSTAQLLAGATASLDQSILSDTLGAGANSSSSGDTLSAVLSDWITYQATGSTSAATPAPTTGTNLDISA
jgi:hypothetical protein